MQAALTLGPAVKRLKTQMPKALPAEGENHQEQIADARRELVKDSHTAHAVW